MMLILFCVVEGHLKIRQICIVLCMSKCYLYKIVIIIIIIYILRFKQIPVLVLEIFKYMLKFKNIFKSILTLT